MAEYICPHCRNPIYDDEALLCLYCGESLRRHGRGTGAGIDGRRLFIIAVALVVLASFVFLVVR